MVAEINNWDREIITKWNLYRFPLNTRDKQIRKIEEEINEFNLEIKRNKKLEEMADVYIVNVVLAGRFRNDMAKLVCNGIEHFKSFDRIKQAVDAKMDINVTRNFKWVRGEWRHVEE